MIYSIAIHCIHVASLQWRYIPISIGNCVSLSMLWLHDFHRYRAAAFDIIIVYFKLYFRGVKYIFNWTLKQSYWSTYLCSNRLTPVNFFHLGIGESRHKHIYYQKLLLALLGTSFILSIYTHNVRCKLFKFLCWSV